MTKVSFNSSYKHFCTTVSFAKPTCSELDLVDTFLVRLSDRPLATSCPLNILKKVSE